MIWKENRPGAQRPADDAEREIWWVQGGIPIARTKLVKKEDGGGGEWSLGQLEHTFFSGRGVEMCYWFWARDKTEITDRYKKIANKAAASLERIASSLREVGK